ncbi:MULTISPECIES: LysE family transporter [Exiguobacterium]|uniref:LysE family transporter n=1 Tax=Exiguobacterium TaxID=33986 RepID=UPI0011EC26C1|nr:MULTISPECIES: LysE family transporter [Exiguobacterium]
MNVVAFLSYVIITSITPGPSNLLVMHESSHFGFRGAWRFNTGILLGFMMLGLVSALGTTVLQATIPMIEPILQWLGAAYLVYLAYKIGFPKQTASQIDTVPATFLSGLLFQLINVKSILFFLTALSTFILPHSTSTVEIVQYTSYAIILGWIALLLWAGSGSLFRSLFQRYDVAFRVIMCGLLLYSAVTIFQ